MAERAFTLKVVTPDEVFYEGQVAYVSAPGTLGSFGVLADHAAFVTSLSKGKMTLREVSGAKKDFRIEGGFFEVSKNRAIVLTDKIISPPGDVA